MKMRDYEYAPAEREKDGPYGRDASAFVSCFRSRANPNLCCSLVDHARARARGRRARRRRQSRRRGVVASLSRFAIRAARSSTR